MQMDRHSSTSAFAPAPVAPQQQQQQQQQQGDYVMRLSQQLAMLAQGITQPQPQPPPPPPPQGKTWGAPATAAAAGTTWNPPGVGPLSSSGAPASQPAGASLFPPASAVTFQPPVGGSSTPRAGLSMPPSPGDLHNISVSSDFISQWLQQPQAGEKVMPPTTTS